MEERDVDQIVRKILSEEVSEHRKFLGEQFQQITWGVATLFTVAAALSAFLIGKSLDDAEKKVVQTIDEKVFEYRIAEDLKYKVNQQVSIAVSNSVESEKTVRQINGLIVEKANSVTSGLKEDIENSISTAINKTIKEKQNVDTEALIKKYVLPKGAVLSFDLEQCPFGWSTYEPAYGRFIRGVDRSGKIDPDGERSSGSLQEDEFRAHTHRVQVAYGPGGQAAAWSMTHNSPTSLPEEGKISIEGGSETRPKNVSLLYCVKS